MEKPGGIIVPLVTPFSANGAVDVESLEKLTEYLLSRGVRGIFTCGTTGEFSCLSMDEKLKITKTVVGLSRNRARVYAGITAGSEEETGETLEKTGLLRPDFMVIAPLVYHSNRKLPRHMERVSAMTSIPLIIYNNDRLIKPPLARENIRTKILKSIVRLDGVAGMKDSSGDIRRLKNYIRAVSGRQDFSIFQGDETGISAGLAAGARGAVPSMGNIFPGPCLELYDSFPGSAEPREDIQREITKLGGIIYAGRKKITGGLKTALWMKKIINSPKTRADGQELSPEEIHAVEKALENCRY